MLQVSLENILTEEDALQRIQEIFQHVEDNNEIYVVTKNGRAAFAVVGIGHLEQNMEGLNLTHASMPTLDTTAITPSTSPVAPPPPVVPQPQFQPTPAPQPLPPTPQPPLAPPPPFPEPVQPQPIPAPQPLAAPVASPTIPPLNGSLTLPDIPEDLTNDSPLG